MARHRRVKDERFAAGMMLRNHEVKHGRPQAPCAVVLTRCGPYTRPMDDDNLTGSLKAVRDEVAKWLGVDDGCGLVTWAYAQRRMDLWCVIIEAQEDDEDEVTDSETAEKVSVM